MNPSSDMITPDIFSSPASLRSAFEEGLERLLTEESLGAFILVLANAMFDEQIFTHLKNRLQEIFNQYRQAYARDLRYGKDLNDAPDDMIVFLKLIAMGFEHLNLL